MGAEEKPFKLFWNKNPTNNVVQFYTEICDYILIKQVKQIKYIYILQSDARFCRNSYW